MSPTSSTRSEPPPYSTNPPQNIDPPQQGQCQQTERQQGHHQQGLQQQGVPQHPQQYAPAAPYQVQQYPAFPQAYIPQPQPQPVYYAAQFQPIPVPVYAFPGPVFYHPPFAALFPPFYQAQPQPQPQYFQQPLHLPIQVPPHQTTPNGQVSLPTSQVQGQHPQNDNNGMQIIPSAQAGFVPHPPAIIPGIPGVHPYPLIVRKEGEGPPPAPVFVDGYAGYEGQVAQE